MYLIDESIWKQCIKGWNHTKQIKTIFIKKCKSDLWQWIWSKLIKIEYDNMYMNEYEIWIRLLEWWIWMNRSSVKRNANFIKDWIYLNLKTWLLKLINSVDVTFKIMIKIKLWNK